MIEKTFEKVLKDTPCPAEVREALRSYQTLQAWLVDNYDEKNVLAGLCYEARTRGRYSLMLRLHARYNQIRLSIEDDILASMAQDVPRGRQAS